MKNAKKTGALLLALVMLFALLSACTSTPAAPTPAPSEAPQTTAAPAPASNSDSGQTASTPEPTPEPEPVWDGTQIPLADDKITFRVWATYFDYFAGKLTDYNELYSTQLMEEQTNVHIEWLLPAASDIQTGFSLMLSSDDLPDMICGFKNYYNKSDTQAVADGLILELTDYADEFLPNYLKRVADAGVDLEIRDDEGRMNEIYTLSLTRMGRTKSHTSGLETRQDWADNLGLAIPETYDEFESYLLALKAAYDLSAPLNMGHTIANSGDVHLIGGYGINDKFYKVNGTDTIGYGPTTPNYRDALRRLHSWYQQGIIDQDFISRTGSDRVLISDNKSAMWVWAFTMLGQKGYNSGRLADPNSFVISVQNPVLNKGEKNHFGPMDVSYLDSPNAITSNCKDIETLLKWCDYLYTEPGALTRNFGKEGESYRFDGEEIVVSNDWFDKWFDMEDSIGVYSAGVFLPLQFVPGVMYDTLSWTLDGPFSNAYGYSEEDEALKVNWHNNDNAYCIPTTLSLTADESSAISNVMADCDTLAAEQYVRFITGVDNIDDDAVWESYVAQMESIGIARALAAEQAAYDRYIHR